MKQVDRTMRIGRWTCAAEYDGKCEVWTVCMTRKGRVRWFHVSTSEVDSQEEAMLVAALRAVRNG